MFTVITLASLTITSHYDIITNTATTTTTSFVIAMVILYATLRVITYAKLNLLVDYDVFHRE